MTKNCSTCVCKEGSCYPSTTIFDKDKTCKSYTPDYEGYIADLENENAELKCECRRCIHTDSPCTLSDYGKDRNGICDHFKDVLDENVELKELLKDKSCLDCEHLHTDLQLIRNIKTSEIKE